MSSFQQVTVIFFFSYRIIHIPLGRANHQGGQTECSLMALPILGKVMCIPNQGQQTLYDSC